MGKRSKIYTQYKKESRDDLLLNKKKNFGFPFCARFTHIVRAPSGTRARGARGPHYTARACRLIISFTFEERNNIYNETEVAVKVRVLELFFFLFVSLCLSVNKSIQLVASRSTIRSTKFFTFCRRRRRCVTCTSHKSYTNTLFVLSTSCLYNI